MAQRGSDDPHENREIEKIRTQERFREGAIRGAQNRKKPEPKDGKK